MALIAQVALHIAPGQTSCFVNEACLSVRGKKERTVSDAQKFLSITILVLHRYIQLAKQCHIVLKHFDLLPLVLRSLEECNRVPLDWVMYGVGLLIKHILDKFLILFSAFILQGAHCSFY